MWTKTFVLNTKSDKIVKIAKKNRSKKHFKPLFVLACLRPLWRVYHAGIFRKDVERLESVVESIRCVRDDRPVNALTTSEKRRLSRAAASVASGNRGTAAAAGTTTATMSSVEFSAEIDVVRRVLRTWMPIGDACLEMVVRHVPSPKRAMAQRMQVLWPEVRASSSSSSSSSSLDDLPSGTPAPIRAVVCADRSLDAPVVAFVTKMVDVDVADFPVGTFVQIQDEEKTEGASSGSTQRRSCLVGFVRVFSGTLRPCGDTSSLWVLPAHHDPSRRPERTSRVLGDDKTVASSAPARDVPALSTTVTRRQEEEAPTPIDTSRIRLFCMLGRDFIEITAAPAGSVVAVVGLEGFVFKYATLASHPSETPSLAQLNFSARPIYRVEVQPKLASQLPALERGLKRLGASDPCVEVTLESDGSYVLATLGELHLEQCIDKLQRHFAGVPISRSPPLTTFNETLAPEETLRALWEMTVEDGDGGDGGCGDDDERCKEKEAAKDTDDATAIGPKRDVSEHETPLSTGVLRFVRNLLRTTKRSELEARRVETTRTSNKKIRIDIFSIPMPASVQDTLEENDGDRTCAGSSESSSSSTSPRCLAFGPSDAPANALVDATRVGSPDRELVDAFRASVVSGFDMAVRRGPLCDEPVRGVIFVLLRMSYGGEKEEESGEKAADAGEGQKAKEEDAEEKREASSSTVRAPAASSLATMSDNFGPYDGQIMSATRSCCRRSFLKGNPRLCEPIFSCVLQTMQTHLGSAYAVLAKRRAKIVNDDLIEGTDIFVIEAMLPVAESFDFASEMRKRTSGAAAAPQLTFARWQLLDVDPFFQPKTLAEREEHGEVVQNKHNVAKAYIDAVRKRKGLATDEKIVIAAEKQRNLSKKK
eukprot:g5425.t1